MLPDDFVTSKSAESWELEDISPDFVVWPDVTARSDLAVSAVASDERPLSDDLDRSDPGSLLHAAAIRATSNATAIAYTVPFIGHPRRLDSG